MALVQILLMLTAAISASAQSLTYDGVLYDATGVPIKEPGTRMTIEVLDSTGTCVLFERSYLFDLSTSGGHFNADLNSGVAPTSGSHQANTLTQALSNSVGNSVTCKDSSIKAFSGVFEKRRIRVSVLEINSVDINDIVLPLQDLDMSPFANEAESAKNFTGTLVGDVSGSSGATSVGRIQGVSVAPTAPTDGQVLVYQNSTSRYEPRIIDSSVLPTNSVTLDNLDFASSSGIVIPSGGAAPSSPNAGQMYYNTSDSKVYFFNGSGWIDTGADGGDFKADGSVSMMGNITLGANSISNDGDSEGISIDASGTTTVSTANTVLGLNVQSGVKVGELNQACGAVVEGTLRYSTSAKKMELCDGGAWREIASQVGGSTGGATSFSEGTTFHEGGDTYFCKKTTVDSSGVNQGTVNINEGLLCDATNNLTCDSGECNRYSIFVLEGGAKRFHSNVGVAYARDCDAYKTYTGYTDATGGDGDYLIDPDQDGLSPVTANCESMTGAGLAVTGIDSGTSGITPLAFIFIYNDDLPINSQLKLTGDGMTNQILNKCSTGTSAVYSDSCTAMNADASAGLAITLGDRGHLSAPASGTRVNLTYLVGAQANYVGGVEYAADEGGAADGKWYQWYYATSGTITNNMLDKTVLGDGSNGDPYRLVGTDFSSCNDALNSPFYSSEGDGIYQIDVDGAGASAAFNVYCDMTTNSGGWTLIIRGDSTEIGASDPPDFRYNATLWSGGSSYGNPGDTTHFSLAWGNTPSFTELRFDEGATPYYETVSYSGHLKDYAKTSGTLKLNAQQSHAYGPWGGRVYRTTNWAICNSGNSSTSWGVGFAGIRTCEHTYGTFWYEGFDGALWIR